MSQASVRLAPAALALCFLGGCVNSVVAPTEAPIETSVKPRINESFLDPNLSVEEYVVRFEGESREVFANRRDIAPNFVRHLARRAELEGHSQVIARRCGESSVDSTGGSVDTAFICDVYQHFEFPRTTMASLHSALREGGQVVIVDFERIPGVSREWTLGHVRAGKEEVIAELKSFGFDLVEEIELAGLEENDVVRFRKR